jgi:hypothetical protein
MMGLANPVGCIACYRLLHEDNIHSFFPAPALQGGTLRAISVYTPDLSRTWGISSMRTYRATLMVAGLAMLGAAGAAYADSYSKAVQKSCAADYHKYCGEYGLESSALRVCMDKAGQSLSKSCVKALIQSGEVSQAEVDRRKTSGR